MWRHTDKCVLQINTGTAKRHQDHIWLYTVTSCIFSFVPASHHLNIYQILNIKAMLIYHHVDFSAFLHYL